MNYLKICFIFIWGSIIKLWWYFTADEVIVYHLNLKGGEICKVRNGWVYYHDRWILMMQDGKLSGGNFAVGLRWHPL